MKILCLLLASLSLFAVSPPTVIQDTVYNADGSLFNGSVVIGWPTFQRADGTRVQGGSRSVDVKAGAFRASLPVYDGYLVLYLNGSVTALRETWDVPASATPLRIRDVRKNVPSADTNATSIQGIAVDSKTPDVSQALLYDPTTKKWTPKAVFTRPDQYAAVVDARSYAAGTVSASSGSLTVIGSATAWDSSMVGWYLVSGGTVARIASVDSAAQVTLTSGWTGTSGSGASYYFSQMVTIPGATHQLGTNAFAISAFQYGGANFAGTWTEIAPDETWVIAGSYDVGLLFDQAVTGLVILQR